MNFHKAPLCSGLVALFVSALLLLCACSLSMDLKKGKVTLEPVESTIDIENGKIYGEVKDNSLKKITAYFLDEEGNVVSQKTVITDGYFEFSIPEEANRVEATMEDCDKSGSNFEVLLFVLPSPISGSGSARQHKASKSMNHQYERATIAHYLVQGSPEDLGDSFLQALALADSPGDVPGNAVMREHVQCSVLQWGNPMLADSGIPVELVLTVSEPEGLLSFTIAEKNGTPLYASKPEDIYLLEGGAQGRAVFRVPYSWNGENAFELTVEDSLGEFRQLSLSLTF